MKLSNSVYLVGGAAYGLSAIGDCNVYLVNCGEEYALIDTGGGMGVKKIFENIEYDELNPKKIKLAFLTHCHFDHIGGAQEIKTRTNCRLLAHKSDAASIMKQDENTLMEMALEKGLSFKAPIIDKIFEDRDQLQIGDVKFDILHTPGHTPGCISIKMIEHDGKTSIFTGDIASTTGRLGFINGPGFNLSEWKNSIKQLIAEKPDRIYPGHNTFMMSSATEDLKLTDVKMNAPWTTIVTSVG